MSIIINTTETIRNLVNARDIDGINSTTISTRTKEKLQITTIITSNP